jgi:hypothetical protein
VALLAVVAAGLAQPAASSAPLRVAHRKASVSLALSAHTVLPRDTVRVRGHVLPAPAGSPVALQRHASSGWTTLVRARTDASGGYLFQIHPTGTHRYRVYSTGRGLSRSFVVRVVSCTPAARPTSGAAVWFSTPNTHGASQTTRGLTRLLCAAAPRSTVDVAMYFIRTGQSQTTPIITALHRLARYRHVKVNILLEGRLVQPGKSLRSSWRELRTFADVRTCSLGCHNEAGFSGGTPSIMHHKFVTISDTIWGHGADPAVLFSSANWSDSQLASHWQSSVMVYDDAALTKEVDLQWDELLACASSRGCASWSDQLTSRGLSPTSYAMTFAHNVWFAAAVQHQGSPGRGTAVTWTPQHHGDPVASSLSAFSCTPAHHTVRLSHMFLTGARYRVIDQLVRLQDQGCDVRVDVSRPALSSLQTAVKILHSRGIDASCVPRVHDKVVLVDAVHTSSGTPDQLVLMGSQSLGGNALRRNDESLFRLSTSRASGRYVAANRAIFDSYLRHWSDMHAHAGSCGVQGEGELTRLASSLTADPDDTVAPQ